MANPKIGKFSRADQIKTNKGIKSKPPKLKRFACCDCGKVFEKPVAVTNHTKSTHFHKDLKKMITCACGNLVTRSDMRGHVCP